MKIYNEYEDKVIRSKVLLADINYREALEKLFPLINRFEAQRKLQDTKFYSRLERDIIAGCMIPPITIAFVSEELNISNDLNKYINENIDNAYILDGIQRMNTLKRASSQEGFDYDRKLLLNIIISPTKDMLLYRMITLNNGQKPMTPRHQIEILTQEIFDFSHLKIEIQSEKARSEQIIRGAFNLGDISKGYLAYLTNNVHNENTKIIGEKMDQILIGRILDSQITSLDLEFKDVIELIDRVASANEEIKTWLKVSNNLIGFCVGIKNSYDVLKLEKPELFAKELKKFEEAFKAINPSKVNLGKYRRELSKYFIEEYDTVKSKSPDEIVEIFAELTL
ncbi:hypothetical protein [Sphingobacterium multivorum]|uniref:hypothetical protein n=1 Tax=Sphingobacterium multivorum TaxID=28454 RepID=UPI00289788FB|nr:hypothetical protein [Sphingobacterium multivorum]